MPTTALYTAGIVATTAQRPLDVIGELAEAMAGKVAFVGGELIVRAAEYQAPVMVLGDDAFAGGAVSVQARMPRESLFNIVTGRIIDSEQGWKPDVDFPRVEAQAYIDDDGGVQLPLEVQFGAVNRSTQAQQVAAVMLREARQALTIVARFNLAAFAVELFDTIALTSTRYGWTEKPFIVMGRSWTIEGLIELSLRETDPSIYAFGNTFDATDVAPNTNIPLAYQVQDLAGLAVESGTAELSDGSIVTRTRITWTQAVDQGVLQNGKVEIQYLDALQTIPPADWPNQTESGSAGESIIVGLRGGRAYVFRARFIGLGGRVRGKWSTPWVLHTVAQPPSVGGQNMLINPSFELDTSNLADNWQVYGNGTRGVLTHSDGAGVFGARSQRIDASNLGTTSSDQAGYYQGVSIAGLVGKSLTFSAYAEGTTNAKVRLLLDWYTASGGTLLSGTSSTGTLTSSPTQTPRFTVTGVVPASCTWVQAYVWIQERPGSAGAAYLRVDAAQLEQGSVATAFTASADEAMAAAAAALATANAAAANASDALNQLTSIASDAVLSPGEKPQAILDYNVLTSEQAGIDAQAAGFGITTEKNAYDTALAALGTYLGTLTGWNTVPGSDVAIVGATWRSNWAAVYGARQTVLNKIAAEAALRAAWANVSGPGRPADNASADLVLTTRGQCVATGNSVAKVGGVSAWDSDAYTGHGYLGAAFVSGVPRSVSDNAMFGLNSDPLTDTSYTSLDWAWQIGAGSLYIYESGAYIAGPFTWSAGQVLTIVYDGAKVQYLQGNTLRRSVAAAADQNLFLDSSFYAPGSAFDQLRFGPLSAVTGIDTGQILDGAATATYQTTVAGPVAIGMLAANPGTTVASLAIGPFLRTTRVVVHASWTGEVTTGAASARVLSAFLTDGTTTSPFSVGPYTVGSTSPLRFSASASFQFSLAGATTTTYYLKAKGGGLTADGTAGEVSNATLRIEVIKA